MQVVIQANPHKKEVNAEKQKVYSAITSLITYLNANWYLSWKARQANNFFLGFCPKLF